MPEKNEMRNKQNNRPIFTDSFARLLLFHVLFVADECDDEWREERSHPLDSTGKEKGKGKGEGGVITIETMPRSAMQGYARNTPRDNASRTVFRSRTG